MPGKSQLIRIIQKLVHQPTRTPIYLVHNDKSKISDVAKGIDISFSHAFIIINALEKKRLLRTKIQGRCRIIKLTPTAVLLGKQYNEIIVVLKKVGCY